MALSIRLLDGPLVLLGIRVYGFGYQRATLCARHSPIPLVFCLPFLCLSQAKTVQYSCLINLACYVSVFAMQSSGKVLQWSPSLCTLFHRDDCWCWQDWLDLLTWQAAKMATFIIRKDGLIFRDKAS